jgi:DNA-binding MarR family transcriptional regulator
MQRAVHVLGLHLEAALGDLGLSQSEMHVLSLLGHAGTSSVAELQRGVRHRPSTLTGILDRLEKREMVVRQINAADRRSNLIELTPSGRAAASRVLHVMAAVQETVFADLTPEELRTFRETLDRVSQSL